VENFGKSTESIEIKRKIMYIIVIYGEKKLHKGEIR